MDIDKNGVSPVLAAVLLAVSAWSLYSVVRIVVALQESVHAGSSPIILDRQLVTDAALFAGGAAGAAWALAYRKSRPVAFLLPVMLVGSATTAWFAADRLAADYLKANAYERCAASDQPRRMRNGYYMAPAWTPPGICGARTVPGPR